MAEAIANQIEYFAKVFDVQSSLDPYDQTWQWRELLGVIALIAALVAVVPMGQLMLQTARFEDLVKTVPESLPRPAGRGRVIFWTTFTVGAIIACLTYIPMAELSQKLFIAASTRQLTWFFPQRMNNAVMLWAILNGTVGFLMFWMSYRYFGRKNGITPAYWGIATSVRELGKTLQLALLLFALFFLVLFSLYYFLHVDYRFLFMGVRPFQPALLPLLGMYVPFFFIFFLSNSLRINAAMRFANQPEWRSMLLGGIANSLGLILIVVVQYVTFAMTGTVYWTDGWLYVNLLFGVVPMMFFLPYFNRFFFRMTGRIYLGPMVTSLIFVMILISNTVIYLPI